MAHSGKATSTAPPHGGAKPPPAKPPADGAKKNQLSPAHPTPHGKDAHGKDPHDKKGGPAPHAAPRRPIRDDEPEEAPPAKSPSWSLKLPSLRAVRRVAIVIGVLLATGAAVYGSVRMVRHHLELARQARIDSAVAVALEAHARKHHGEGRAFEEISFTDYIRHCLGATVTAPGYVTAHGLENATGPALLADAEAACLRSKVADILLMPKKEEVPEDDEMKWRETEIRAILVFAREHGYRFPSDLMAYEHPPESSALRQKSRLP